MIPPVTSILIRTNPAPGNARPRTHILMNGPSTGREFSLPGRLANWEALFFPRLEWAARAKRVSRRPPAPQVLAAVQTSDAPQSTVHTSGLYGPRRRLRALIRFPPSLYWT